jgi:hypothetical protein
MNEARKQYSLLDTKLFFLFIWDLQVDDNINVYI